MNAQINSLFTEFETALSKWSQQPLSALFKTADESEQGIAYDRFVVGEHTAALVLCIVRKGTDSATTDGIHLAKSSTGRNQPRSMLNDQTLAFLLNQPAALTATVVATLDDPETTLYASLNPQQIQKLETDFLKHPTAISTEVFSGGSAK